MGGFYWMKQLKMKLKKMQAHLNVDAVLLLPFAISAAGLPAEDNSLANNPNGSEKMR
jgi:hypothetical protein